MLEPFEFFKGAGRTPTYIGVPAFPLMWLTIIVFGLSVNITIFFAVLWPIGWGVMYAITKYDDKAFRIIGLWLSTTFRNWRGRALWGGSSYAPTCYQRRR